MGCFSRESLNDPFTPDYKSGQDGFDSVGQAFGNGDDDNRGSSHLPPQGIQY